MIYTASLNDYIYNTVVICWAIIIARIFFNVEKACDIQMVPKFMYNISAIVF